jgi:uncharacterized RDD family membrane protein YckC
MRCLYCGNQNSEDEPRCQRCARRLQVGPARSAPSAYAGANALAVAVAPARVQPELAIAPPPARVQVPRQTRLFADSDGSKVLQFPSTLKPPEPKPRSRRQPQQPRQDGQTYLDFLPVASHSPRTLKTSVEAVIYCDAPVATPIHRAVGFGLDFSVVMIAIGVFLATFILCGGEFPKITTPVALAFGGAFLGIALFYGLLWVLTGSESAGARWTGLQFINFDGTPIDRRERAIRFAAACLSFFSVGLGVLWSLADEEGLTWHDHMSKTFPTIRA